MFLRMVYDDKLAEAAYIIGCQRTGQAIVIDPQRDVDRYISIAAKEGLRITAVAETHIHADFLSGARELAEQGAKVFVSDEGDAEWKYEWLGSRSAGGAYDHQLLHDGDMFQIGGIEFKAIHTPGHTPEHISFMVTDRGGGAAEPMGVATGDFVFVGDVGRPDLLESAVGKVGAADASAKRLFASVDRFKAWPDYLQVWPAHGSGSACGKALGAVPQSTVGYEKRFSPAFLASGSEGDFVKFILDGQPEPPSYFARMKRDNKKGPRVLGSLPKPRVISAAELSKLDTQRVALIDTRTWKEYREGHIPGSLYVPVNNSFTTDAGSMIAEDQDIYLLVDGSKLDEAVRGLVRVGLDRIVGWCEPAALEQLRADDSKLAKTREIDVAAARTLVESGRVSVLDVRRTTEFKAGHIAGAQCVAHTQLAGRLAEVPRDREVLVNCQSGGRSARACALLERNGFRAINLKGGYLDWTKAPAS